LKIADRILLALLTVCFGAKSFRTKKVPTKKTSGKNLLPIEFAHRETPRVKKHARF
jgi:hypothetical protein